MAKNWEKVASIVWPKLVRLAKARDTRSYTKLAHDIKTAEATLTNRNIYNALAPIQNHCLDNGCPLLTAVVVRKVNGKLTVPGSGFAWDHIDDWEEERDKVRDFEWEETIVETNFLSAYSAKSLAKKIIKSPDKASELYATVKSRGDQQRVFREMLLDIYDGRCAMCGLGFAEALEAAHIIPWSKSNDFSPNNGLLLCANHHKLFDNGIVFVTKDYEIKCDSKKAKLQKPERSDRQALLNLCELRLPKDEKHFPSGKLLAQKGRQ